MARLIVTLGLPASGKSTWAATVATQRTVVVVNKDDIRADLVKQGWVWSRDGEAMVVAARNFLIKDALTKGLDVISSDTNFGKHLDDLKALAVECGADFSVEDFTDVPVWECATRNAARGYTVPEKVIWDMAEKHLAPHKLVPGRKSPQLFVDLDGVLADFDGFISKEFGIENNRDNELPNFWDIVGSYRGDLYSDMQPFAHARDLWNSLRGFSPVILSGAPWGHVPEAGQQKRDWVAKHIDPEARIITCKSRNKRLYGVEGDILLDDWRKYEALWVGMGGIFVHHTDPTKSINEIKEILLP